MKIKLIVFLLIFIVFDTYAKESYSKSNYEQKEIKKRKKNGSYRKKKHLFKKLIQGKRYCDCPKH